MRHGEALEPKVFTSCSVTPQKIQKAVKREREKKKERKLKLGDDTEGGLIATTRERVRREGGGR